jgi:hypothetical protein
MSWDVLRDWIDNPIFIKHVRSRLRWQPLAAGAVVVIVLSMCIVWAGYENDALWSGRAFEWLAMLQGVILIIMGASQVSAAVGSARLSGILDFHRVSPLTPAELTLGFIFGAPIREYVLFACTLPFVALFMAFGVPTVHGYIELFLFLMALAWFFHGLALLNSLIMKPGRNSRGAVAVIGLSVLFFAYAMRMGRILPSISLFDEDARLTFFGTSLPWLAVVLLYIGSLLFFIYLAACRRMGEERIHPFSKPQAIAALAALSLLMLGGVWRIEDNGVVEVIVLYLLVLAALLLILLVTPTRSEFIKGLWRARKQGRGHLSWWEDLAVNQVFVMIACAIALAAASLARWAIGTSLPGRSFVGSTTGNFPLAIAIGVLVIAYFGMAIQYFLLRFGRRGPTYFALFLFLAWLVPLVAGTSVAMASPYGDNVASSVLFGLTPISGIGMVGASTSNDAYRAVAQGPAITPALLFTFVFNSLLVSARRRAHREFVTSTAKSVTTDLAQSAINGEPAARASVPLVAQTEDS